MQNINHKIFTIFQQHDHLLFSYFNYLTNFYSIKINKSILSPFIRQFIPPSIQTWIQNHHSLCTMYSFVIFNNIQCNLYFFNHKHKHSTIHKYIAPIIFILSLFYKNSKHYKCIIYFTPCKKKFPSKSNQILNSDNVNSGVTISNNTIIIFREEEWLKVFIHECLHLFEYDFANINNYSLDLLFQNYIQQNTNNGIPFLKSSYHLYEAYTETIAELLYFNFYVWQNTTSFNNFLIQINILLNKQILFAKHQAISILSYSKYNIKHSMYYEDSSVISYYILKYYFLKNINSWFQLNHNEFLISNNLSFLQCNSLSHARQWILWLISSIQKHPILSSSFTNVQGQSLRMIFIH